MCLPQCQQEFISHFLIVFLSLISSYLLFPILITLCPFSVNGLSVFFPKETAFMYLFFREKESTCMSGGKGAEGAGENLKQAPNPTQSTTWGSSS